MQTWQHSNAVSTMCPTAFTGIMGHPVEIEYRIGNKLDLDQVIELYRESTLGERRPIGLLPEDRFHSTRAHGYSGRAGHSQGVFEWAK